MLDQDAPPARRPHFAQSTGLTRVIAVLAGTGLALLILGAGLGLLLVGRHGGGSIQGWDNAVWRWSIQHRWSFVGMDKVIANVGDAAPLGLMCFVLSAAMFALRRSPRAFIPTVAYLGAEGLVYLIRAVIHRGRPVTANYPAPGAISGIHETSYSFPSGHATTVTAVFFALFGTIAIARRWWWPWLLALPPAAFVADSRLLLGVHWFSDVAIGMILGIIWGSVVAIMLARCAWQDLGIRKQAVANYDYPRGDSAEPN